MTSLRDAGSWSAAADALLAHEVEMSDALRDLDDAAHDAEREAFEADRLATFCLSGFGHEEIDYEGGNLLSTAAETLTGVSLIEPATATCRACGTVLS